MTLYNQIWKSFLSLSIKIQWFNPLANIPLKDIYDSAHPSMAFMNTQPFPKDNNKPNNFNGWLSRSVLEGVPVIKACDNSANNFRRRTLYLSVCEVSAMLLQIGLATPTIRRRYFYDEILNLQILVLQLIKITLQSQIMDKKEGIIIVMDMTKSTPFIFKTKDPVYPVKELAELLQCMHRIGAFIKFGSHLIGSNNSKYWITEGDKFIGFIPFNDVHDGKHLLNFLKQLQKVLLEIKYSFKISFKVGIHWGSLFISGDIIKSNSEIIKATRVMEFSKREGVIIISETLKNKIVDNPPNIKLNGNFKTPMILLNGKPNQWIRPEEVTISITDKEEMRLYEIEI